MTSVTLAPREAALRAEALRQITRAKLILDADGNYSRNAFRWVLRDCPRAALRDLRRAKAALVLAERALQKWAGR